MTFNVLKAVKHSCDQAFISRIDLVDMILHESVDTMLCEDPIESCLMLHDRANMNDGEEEEKWLDANMIYTNPRFRTYEAIERIFVSRLLPSVEKAPTLEMKPLPSHLKYAYLSTPNHLPVIVSSLLTGL